MEYEKYVIFRMKDKVMDFIESVLWCRKYGNEDLNRFIDGIIKDGNEIYQISEQGQLERENIEFGGKYYQSNKRMNTQKKVERAYQYLILNINERKRVNNANLEREVVKGDKVRSITIHNKNFKQENKYEEVMDKIQSKISVYLSSLYPENKSVSDVSSVMSKRYFINKKEEDLYLKYEELRPLFSNVEKYLPKKEYISFVEMIYVGVLVSVSNGTYKKYIRVVTNIDDGKKEWIHELKSELHDSNKQKQIISNLMLRFHEFIDEEYRRGDVTEETKNKFQLLFMPLIMTLLEVKFKPKSEFKEFKYYWYEDSESSWYEETDNRWFKEFKEYIERLDDKVKEQRLKPNIEFCYRKYNNEKCNKGLDDIYEDLKNINIQEIVIMGMYYYYLEKFLSAINKEFDLFIEVFNVK